MPLATLVGSLVVLCLLESNVFSAFPNGTFRSWREADDTSWVILLMAGHTWPWSIAGSPPKASGFHAIVRRRIAYIPSAQGR